MKTTQKQKTTENNATSPEYLAWKTTFEETHYFLSRPPRYVQEINGEPYDYSYVEFLRDIHTNNEDVKTWMEDKAKRTYHQRVFVPYTLKDTSPPNCINTFKGFRLHAMGLPAKPVSTAWFHNYLRDLVGGNVVLYSFLYDFVADIVQNPQRSPELAIVMKGIMGAGKDTLSHIIASLIGYEYKLTTTDFTDLFGSFNSPIKNKILINVEEVSIQESKKYHERMKSFITDKQIHIRELYKAKYDATNVLRLLFSSNNDTPFYVPVGCRRFIVINVSTILKGNTQRFNEIYGNLLKDDVMASLFHELLNYDLNPEWNLEKNRPRTKEQISMETENIYPIWKMLDEYLNPENPNYDPASLKDHVQEIPDTPDGYSYIETGVFTEMFLEFCDREANGITREKFSKKAMLDNKLRDCEGMQVKVKRFDKEKKNYKYINHAEVVKYIHDQGLLGRKLAEVEPQSTNGNENVT